MKKLILAMLAVLAMSSIALAHPGGRDAYGGHYDKSKTAEEFQYHVHEGPLEGHRYKSQENMVKALEKAPGGQEVIKKVEARKQKK